MAPLIHCAMTFDISFYIMLHKDIGLKSVKVCGMDTFVIRAIRLTL